MLIDFVRLIIEIYGAIMVFFPFSIDAICDSHRSIRNEAYKKKTNEKQRRKHCSSNILAHSSYFLIALHRKLIHEHMNTCVVPKSSRYGSPFFSPLLLVAFPPSLFLSLSFFSVAHSLPHPIYHFTASYWFSVVYYTQIRVIIESTTRSASSDILYDDDTSLNDADCDRWNERGRRKNEQNFHERELHRERQ